MHGGDIYSNRIRYDFSVNLNPYPDEKLRKNEEEKRYLMLSPIAEGHMVGMNAGGKYPDIDQTALRCALAALEGTKSECVFAGNGASQLLMAAVAAIDPRCALIVEPAFSGYRHALFANGECVIRQHFLKEEDGFVLNEDVIESLSDEVDVLFLTDPNNPTGQNIDPGLLDRILDRARQNKTAVVLDESFLTVSEGNDCKRSARLVAKYDNVFIIRSFTKSFSLPGVRMGYVLSSGENIKNVRAHLPEWNISALSDAVMEACARISQDGRYYEESMKMIKKERAFLTVKLTELGFKVFDSDTLFLLIKGREGLYEKLLRSHILIRKCDDFDGLDVNFYRIAVKTHRDNVHLIDTLKRIIQKS